MSTSPSPSRSNGDDPRGLRVGPFLSEEQLWIRIEEEMDRLCLLAEKWSDHPADCSR